MRGEEEVKSESRETMIKEEIWGRRGERKRKRTAKERGKEAE